jgi:transcriptional regulator with PAS, ATPase and Fis domain
MDKPGYFDRAHKGTLFLDEVGELKPALQVKLLRVLQDGEYIPLGDTTAKTADVRIIAATNKDLKILLQQEKIREDFYYRIRVIVINMPPLRDRKEDIPLLVEHFGQQYAKGKEPPAIPAKIIETLFTYDWPGNVRELQNELQRYLAEQRLEFTTILPEDQSDLPLSEAVGEYEKHYISRVLQQNQGNKTKTAVKLGIDRKTLHTKLRKYGITTRP